MEASVQGGGHAASATKVKCVLVGCGGHARVVMDCLRFDDSVDIVAAFDADARRWGETFMGVRVIGGDNDVAAFARDGVRAFVLGVGSTGDSAIRIKLFDKMCGHGLAAHSIRHLTAIVAADARLGAGSQVFAGAIVNPAAHIAENVIINTGTIIEHDCHIERHAHISPGVRLGGGVHVGEAAHVGIGAAVREGIRIGARAVIGAGAVVIDDIPDGALAVGVPAKIREKA